MNRLFMLLVVVALVYLYAADGRVDLAALRGDAAELWQQVSPAELAEADAPELIEEAVPMADHAIMTTLEAIETPALTEEQATPITSVIATPPATAAYLVPEVVAPPVVQSPVIAQRFAAVSQEASKPMAEAPQTDGMLPVTDIAVIRRRAEVLAFDEAVSSPPLGDGGLAPLANTVQPKFMTAHDRHRELSNLVSELELLSKELEILR